MLRRRASAAPDPILQLFASGEQGAIIDPSVDAASFQTTALSTLAGDTDPFGASVDQSPNGQNATQGTAAKRPQRIESGGLWYSKFDGTDDEWAIDGLAGLAEGSKKFSVAVAIARQKNNGVILEFADSANSDIHLRLRVVTGDIRMRRSNGTAVSQANVATEEEVPLGTPVVMVLEYDGTDMNFYLNGGSAVALSSTFSIPTLDNFRFPSEDATFLAADYYGLIVREGNFTTDERDAVTQHLADLAGVTL